MHRFPETVALERKTQALALGDLRLSQAAQIVFDEDAVRISFDRIPTLDRLPSLDQLQ